MEKKVSCATTLVSQINYLDKNNIHNTTQHKTRDMTQFDRNIAKKAKAENIYTLVNNNVIDTILRAVIKIEKKNCTKRQILSLHQHLFDIRV